MSLNYKPEELSQMILNYLQKRPDAADTLEGITRWWLEFQRVELSANDVKDALESLVQKGIIRIFKAKNGSTFYKIDKEKLH